MTRIVVHIDALALHGLSPREARLVREDLERTLTRRLVKPGAVDRLRGAPHPPPADERPRTATARWMRPDGPGGLGEQLADALIEPSTAATEGGHP